MTTSVNLYSKEQTDTLLGNKANSVDVYTKSQVDTSLAGKQATLVSGTNIKTINSTSILGSGDIVISGGGSTVTLTPNQAQDPTYYTLSIS